MKTCFRLLAGPLLCTSLCIASAAQKKADVQPIYRQQIDFASAPDYTLAPVTEYHSDSFSVASSSFKKPFLLRNSRASLGRKFLRGEKIIGGTELLGMGILIMMPKKVTKWQDDWMQDAKRNLKRSWTHMPVWDHDDWQINYVGHPMAGALYYNVLRSQNASVLSSFVFSAVQSTFWEYVVEGIAERPSQQDLVVTPVIGSLLGEATHALTLKMGRNGFSFFEKVFVVVFNPMYAINNGLPKQVRKNFIKSY